MHENLLDLITLNEKINIMYVQKTKLSTVTVRTKLQILWRKLTLG